MPVVNLPNNLTSMFDDIKLRLRKLETVPPVPAGVVSPFAAATAPNGWLLCDGTVYNISAYPTLGALLLATYGGNGTTTFAVPDLRGRAIAGKDDMGGTAASRLTSAVSGITGTTLGAAGGQENLHQHSHPNSLTGNVAAASGHTHGPGGYLAAIGATNGDAQRIGYVAAGVNGPGIATYSNSGVIGGLVVNSGPFNHYTPVYGSSGGPSADTTVNITNANNAQTGTAQNVQPTLILNYIIRAS